MSPPSAEKLVGALAARALLHLEESDLEPLEKPLARTATAEVGGWQVTVTVCRYDGPARLVLSPVGERELPEAAKALRDIELNILEAAPKADKAPITMRLLAQVAGYGWNSHYRNAVNSLVERGLLVRIRGGVRLAHATNSPADSPARPNSQT